MYRFLIRGSLLLVFVIAIRAQSPSLRRFTPANPGGGGWFERIAAGPTGLVVACSDLSGAYISRDRGMTFTSVGPARGLVATHVAGVAFDANDGKRIFLGTDQGVFRSVDYGHSFQQVHATGYVETLAVARSNPQRIYAAWHPAYDQAAGRMLRSADGGSTWQLVDLNLPSGLRIIEVLVKEDDADTVIILTGEGRFASGPKSIYRSTDGGVHWTEVGGGFNQLVVDIALDPFDSDALYASVDDPNPSSFGHLYRSPNLGSTWNLLGNRGGHIWPDREVAGVIRMLDARTFFPWDPREGIWESTQGGVGGSWTRVGSVTAWDSAWSGAPWAFEATQQVGAFGEDQSDASTLYWVNSQFGYVTRDRGRHVSPVFSRAAAAGWSSTGLDNVVVVDLAVAASDANVVYAGFLDLGIWRSLDGGRQWTPLNAPSHTGGWNGHGGNTWSVLVDPVLSGTVWAPQSGEALGDATLLKSTDHGTTRITVGAGLPPGPILGLSLDPTSPVGARRIFATVNGDVFGSDDGGVTFTLRLANGGLHFTAVDPLGGATVYAGGEDGLWRSTSSGLVGTWLDTSPTAFHGNVAGPPTWGWVGVESILPDPGTAGRVYAVVHGANRGLYVSQDHGATWGATPIYANDVLRDVAIRPGDPMHLYAASSSAFDAGGYDPASQGVVESLDGGLTWTTLHRGLAWPLVLTLATSPADPEMLLAGAAGPGIHRLTRETLSLDSETASAAGGGVLSLSLTPGPNFAGRTYVLLATISGTFPGVDLAGGTVHLDLQPDLVTQFSLQYANSPWLADSLSSFDGTGAAQVTATFPPGLLGVLVGQTVHYAYVTLGPTDFASPPRALLVLP